jgi:hypothetical protein
VPNEAAAGLEQPLLQARQGPAPGGDGQDEPSPRVNRETKSADGYRVTLDVRTLYGEGLPTYVIMQGGDVRYVPVVYGNDARRGRSRSRELRAADAKARAGDLPGLEPRPPSERSSQHQGELPRRGR